ncbi:MAG: FAD-dependent oxidoreductase [Chloroflexota bacterium]|nr:FAD-dependent oxidoreductase [Chloroflexota bacterium]
MNSRINRIDTDVVIAGAGPGGCTLAKELSKKGKSVVLIERGGDKSYFSGTPLELFSHLEKKSKFIPSMSTKEGYSLVLGQGVGGGTLLYAGSAFLPDVDYWRRYGIELEQDIIDEAMREMWYSIPPDDFIGEGNRRVRQAANELGYPFDKVARHIDFEKCRVGCENCTFGCRRDAKWTAKVFADEAVESGATLLTHTRVEKVAIDNGVAGGITAVDGSGERYEISARVVVLSAGGVHTAEILQRSGFKEAGSWFTGDPTRFTFGFIKEGKGNGFEHNMTVGWHDEEHGVVFCAMVAPFLAWHLQFAQAKPLKWMSHAARFRKALGIFGKVSDESTGRIDAGGVVSKTFTDKDRGVFSHAIETATRILVHAGCDPNDIYNVGFTLGHPSSTVRVGELLDTNLQTSVKNLYCCDTSVFPSAPGRPPALTVVVLAKRLARHLESVV